MTERSVRQLEQDQKVPLSYIGKVGVGIPVRFLILQKRMRTR